MKDREPACYPTRPGPWSIIFMNSDRNSVKGIRCPSSKDLGPEDLPIEYGPVKPLPR